MLRELFIPLIEKFSYLNLFNYITFRAAYGAITALFLSITIMPFVIRLQLRKQVGERIRSDGPQSHQVKQGTPTMGGIIISFAIFVSIFLWMDITQWYTWVVIFLLIAFCLLGFIDDYLKFTQEERMGLRFMAKLLGQIGIGAVTGIVLMLVGDEKTSFIYFPFVKDVYIDLGWFYVVFVIFVIVGTTNAVNLTDGLDGLASGLVIFIALGFTVLSYVTGRADFSNYLQIPFVRHAGELTIVSFSIVGACMGFLWYNSNPASIMMGDSGSLTLGALISALALITKHELLLVIMGGIFVIETLSVIIQVASFKLFKKRVFKMAPLHHHFEMCGWKENKIVIRFWIAGVFFLIFALSTLKIR